MNVERPVAVVTDSGCSIRPKSPEALKLGITIVPLEVRFWEKGQYVPYSDTDISPDDFYHRMRTAQKIPQTSGAVPGRLFETFERLSGQKKPIISINITSKHSVAWESAVLAKNMIHEKTQAEGRECSPIEVIDSKHVSLATWFPTYLAGELSQKGATLEQITSEVLEAISKIQTFVTLETFDNLKKGGRADNLVKAVLASALKIYPVLGFADGKLKDYAKTRTAQKARDRMVEMVGDAGKLVKIAVIHTNALNAAERVKEALTKMYEGTIPIYDAGPVLAVHAGEGAVGIAFQTV
jgi:DegV family protein with EDD domain